MADRYQLHVLIQGREFTSIAVDGAAADREAEANCLATPTVALIAGVGFVLVTATGNVFFEPAHVGAFWFSDVCGTFENRLAN
jgi:hypothetical protein